MFTHLIHKYVHNTHKYINTHTKHSYICDTYFKCTFLCMHMYYINEDAQNTKFCWILPSEILKHTTKSTTSLIDTRMGSKCMYQNKDYKTRF